MHTIGHIIIKDWRISLTTVRMLESMGYRVTMILKA